MSNHNETSRLTAILLPPTIVALGAIEIYLIPPQLQILLVVWVVASIPVGVLFGHCVLSEK